MESREAPQQNRDRLGELHQSILSINRVRVIGIRILNQCYSCLNLLRALFPAACGE